MDRVGRDGRRDCSGAEGQFEAAGMGAALVPRGRADWDRRIAAVRAARSGESFAAAWAAGQAMPLEQAIAYALEESGDASSTAGSNLVPAVCLIPQ